MQLFLNPLEIILIVLAFITVVIIEVTASNPTPWQYVAIIIFILIYLLIDFCLYKKNRNDEQPE